MPSVRDYEETAGIQSAKDPVHFCGVEPITLAANGEVTFSIQPNMDMEPNQLIISDAFAPSVAVTGMSIGPISIAAGDGPMPGDSFKSQSTMRFRPAVPITQGQPLRVRVRNLTATAINNFYLGIVGKVKRST